MLQFLDANGNGVELSFECGAFSEEAKHVLVICKWKEGWLLTNHKQRGLEFPGGKLEAGESLEEAARREAFEETGATFESLTWLAEYKVYDGSNPFVKAVFLGEILDLESKADYHETNGPVMVKGDLLQLRFNKEYSFIMKDQVVEECLKHLNAIKSSAEW